MHENCVVLKFSYAGYSVMLTGDSNKPCWERVVGYYEGREDETGVEGAEGAEPARFAPRLAHVREGREGRPGALPRGIRAD